MKVIQINPYDKKIEIADLKDIDDNFSINLGEFAKEVEKGIKIIAYPVIEKEKNGIFYYVVQNGKKGQIYTFNGIGIVFCDEINDEIIEKIRNKVAW